MTVGLLAIGIFLAVGIIVASRQLPSTPLKAGAALAAAVVLFIFFALSSIRFVGDHEVGIIVRNFGRDLPAGAIIAVNGEKGPQAEVLGPGWHFWLWPGIIDVDTVPLTHVPEGQVGLITTSDGVPLPDSEIYAPEWSTDKFQLMLNAEYFLAQGGGYKGPQASVLTPGDYRLNTRLYDIEMVPVTNIERASVGVIKSNVGKKPEQAAGGEPLLVEPGYRGVWREPYTPQELYLHTNAYEMTPISTKRNVIRYTAVGSSEGDEREIRVRSSDGFTFPVDVRIEYLIRPEDAPRIVATLGDDGPKLLDVLTSAVRAIFRNNAERVKALDYVQQRSLQESQSLAMLQEEMAKLGVTVTAVRIGDVGDEQTLGSLLKTQTDREIALQEQRTFQEQQLAAEERKALERTQQEATGERGLADATYGVKIAEQEKLQAVIQAEAEAEATLITAKAQAEAYRMIAEQIGSGNAATIELLKIVGERGINITPRVMVIGNGHGGESQPAQSAETTALIGTMLDTMLDKAPSVNPPK